LMKVEEIEATPLRVKMEEKLVGGTFSYGDYQTVVVRAICDGVEGWGEAMSRNDPRVNSILVGHLAKGVVGMTFEGVGEVWTKIARDLRVRGHTRGSGMEALSGIEMALFDSVGKREGRGLAAMFSEKPANRTKAIAGSLFDSRGSMEDQVETARQKGLAGAKVKVGFGPKKDLAILEEVKRLWPDGMIVADANGAYDVETAVVACETFRPLDLAWFEEPVLSDDWDGYRRLKGLGVRIGAGESWFSSDFDMPLGEKLVDVLEPSVSRCGGVSVEMKAGMKANQVGIGFSPMTGMNSGLSLAASLHAASARHAEAVEYNPFVNPLQTELVHGLPEPRSGEVSAPQGPGLGVEVDVGFLKAHRVG